MSGLYFDRGRRVLVVRFGSVMSEETVTALRGAVRSFVAAAGRCRLVVDFSAVETASVPGHFIAEIAQRGPIVTEDMRIFVAPRPELFGLSRMYEMQQTETADVTRVVRTMAAALEALGIESLALEPVSDPPGGAR